jgi:hypothetical protein
MLAAALRPCAHHQIFGGADPHCGHCCAARERERAEKAEAERDEARAAVRFAEQQADCLRSHLMGIRDLKAPFSRDPLQRAENAVAEAQRIASEALRG